MKKILLLIAVVFVVFGCKDMPTNDVNKIAAYFDRDTTDKDTIAQIDEDEITPDESQDTLAPDEVAELEPEQDAEPVDEDISDDLVDVAEEDLDEDIVEAEPDAAEIDVEDIDLVDEDTMDEDAADVQPDVADTQPDAGDVDAADIDTTDIDVVDVDLVPDDDMFPPDTTDLDETDVDTTDTAILDEDNIIPDADNDNMTCDTITCTDATTSLMWQRGNSVDMTEYEAENYCSNLTLGGFNDWRLPNITELRTLIRNCPGTISDGACNVNDPTCLETSCFTSVCGQCSNNNGPGEYGLYWEAGLWDYTGDIYGYFWSSSVIPSQTTVAWRVRFYAGIVDYVMRSASDSLNYYARCVRGPL